MIPYGPLLSNSLTQLLTTLPLLIVWLVSIIIAIVRWKINPRASLLTLLGLVILMGVHILSVIFNTSFYYIASYSNMNPLTTRTVSIIVQVVFSLTNAGAWVMVLIAIFGKPKKKANVA